MRLHRELLVLSLGAGGAIIGCGDEGTSPAGPGGGGAGGSAGGGSGGSGEVTTFGGDRPVELFVPSSYDEATPAPLLILLHGYGVSGQIQEILFELEPVAEARGMLYAHPDGTVDESGSKFWNATDQCCDFDGTGIDDSGYLLGLVDEIAAEYNVDDKRIYFAGHSNGHFMSYRMACDHSGRIAAIAGLAGATFEDSSKCEASDPVSILHVHGTADEAVPYELAAQPSAEMWADYDGCDAEPLSARDIDLESQIEGAETSVLVWEGCDAGGAVELWTIEGGSHIPNLSPDFGDKIVDWLLTHPKP